MNDFADNSSPTAFRSDEMIACANCKRSTPPNRNHCLYCGKELEFSSPNPRSLKLNLKKLESFENGFNLIINHKEPFARIEELGKISKSIGIELDTLNSILSAREPLPCARLLSLNDAEAAEKLFANEGIDTFILPDESLKLKTETRRLRGLEFAGGDMTITLFNSGERIKIPFDEIKLIISGSIFEKKIETSETYSKSKESKPLSVGETSQDEKVIDLYRSSDETGFRIFTRGFDFSCLGQEMSYLASDNIRKLFLEISKVSRFAKSLDNYDRFRNLMGDVWEVEAVGDVRGVEKKGVGKFVRNSAIKYSNLGQFTRYSRLQRHFL